MGQKKSVLKQNFGNLPIKIYDKNADVSNAPSITHVVLSQNIQFTSRSIYELEVDVQNINESGMEFFQSPKLVCYFEIHLTSVPKECLVRIGYSSDLSEENISHVAFLSDGRIELSGDEQSDPSEKFGEGDVIGCLIHKNRVHIMKNGTLSDSSIEIPPSVSPLKFFPTVAVDKSSTSFKYRYQDGCVNEHPFDAKFVGQEVMTELNLMSLITGHLNTLSDAQSLGMVSKLWNKVVFSPKYHSKTLWENIARELYPFLKVKESKISYFTLVKGRQKSNYHIISDMKRTSKVIDNCMYQTDKESQNPIPDPKNSKSPLIVPQPDSLLSTMSAKDIEEAGLVWEKRCPIVWDNLVDSLMPSMGEKNRSFCGVCKSSVQRVYNLQELYNAVNQKSCVIYELGTQVPVATMVGSMRPDLERQAKYQKECDYRIDSRQISW
eukprot:TRINITY_DN1340_c0_g2_i1.p1 TRINITY_DN1340_c0_g2~~TRINITY_DN1340_c0_g2_i1.p1  ORF type:complete len:450 (-),score=54.98 TRINITY_DN1340_c0_g2_i1:858-2165(-)